MGQERQPLLKRPGRLTILGVAVVHGEAGSGFGVHRLRAAVHLVITRPPCGAREVWKGGAVDIERPLCVARLDDLFFFLRSQGVSNMYMYIRTCT